MNPEDLAASPPARLPFAVTRAVGAAVAADHPDGGLMPTMTGYFSTFEDWYEVDSMFEGHFMESIGRGAFEKTISESRDQMKVLYDHGQDPQIGNKILGPIEDLHTDKRGPKYEVPLFDTSYNRDLAPGLEAGVYGSSFRFTVEKDVWDHTPPRSRSNPDGIPERTITEARVFEFGPVTFPANAKATAGARSTTDAFYRRSRDPEQFEALLRSAQVARTPVRTGAADQADEPPSDTPPEEPPRTDTPEPPTPDEPAPEPEDPPDGGPLDSTEVHSVSEDKDKITRADRPARITELEASSARFVAEHDGELSADLQKEWDDLRGELIQLRKDEQADANRRAFVGTIAEDGSRTEAGAAPADYSDRQIVKAPLVRDIYSRAEIRAASRNVQHEKQLTRDSAMRAIEAASFNHMDRAKGQAAVETTLRETEDPHGYIPQRILLTGNPTYRRALHKTLLGMMLNPEEMQAYSDFQEFERGMGRFESERAMGQVTGSAGGFGVTFDLDPTMIQTSTGAVVPYRRACRVVTTTTNEWRAVTSGGVVASYAAEAAVGTDNSPTLAQPAALVQKAHCFVPFSMELQGDYATLEAELGREITDAKDVLEAVQFSTGAGTTVFPQGIVTGSTTAYTTATTLVLAAADLYGTEFTLAPRFRQGAMWFANRAFYNRIRQIDTAGGAQLWTQNLQAGLTNDFQGNTGYNLLGYPANEASGFVTTISSGSKMAVFGNPNYFVVVDRVGMNLELVPILTQQATAGSGFGIPTGQRGVYAWWRNTSKVLSATAFLTVTGL